MEAIVPSEGGMRSVSASQGAHFGQFPHAPRPQPIFPKNPSPRGCHLRRTATPVTAPDHLQQKVFATKQRIHRKRLNLLLGGCEPRSSWATTPRISTPRNKPLGKRSRIHPLFVPESTRTYSRNHAVWLAQCNMKPKRPYGAQTGQSPLPSFNVTRRTPSENLDLS
jgi:hypothetical protein